MQARILQLFLLFFLMSCQFRNDLPEFMRCPPSQIYLDKVGAAWQAIMVANHTGLVQESLYLGEPSPADSVDLVLLEQWSTDDDTAIEWVDLITSSPMD